MRKKRKQKERGTPRSRTERLLIKQTKQTAEVHDEAWEKPKKVTRGDKL